MNDTEERKARKKHICSLCFKPIPKGEVYSYLRLTPWMHDNNDGFSNYRAHLECDKNWSEISSECDGILPLDVYEWQDMTEHLKEQPNDK